MSRGTIASVVPLALWYHARRTHMLSGVLNPHYIQTQVWFIITVGTEKRREKVVVLRELQRAIIYTRELSKQAMEGHVSRPFTVYSVS
jgi:hypothetical protein